MVVPTPFSKFRRKTFRPRRQKPKSSSEENPSSSSVLTTGRAWARLLAGLKKNGLAMPVKDSLIAATALAHNLIVATRNVVGFRHAGVCLENPFGK